MPKGYEVAEGRPSLRAGVPEPVSGLVTAADHLEAARFAREAGRLLVELRTSINAGLSPEEARHEGDRRSHVFLAGAIAELYPNDGLLSEEGADSTERLGRQRVWVVDPLDGTREFGEPGRSDWAVHVCLSVDGRAEVGAVALPALNMVLSTAEPPRPAVREPGPLRLVVSRTRPPASAERVAELLGAELVPMGSAGAKAMAVVSGQADIYLHSGGQYEWDSAAPVAVAHSAGLHASRIDGSALVYNQPSPWLPDLVICRPDLVETVFRTLAEVAEQPG
jgi:3'(2'), 5'-bisphosphate nucleotidase